MRDSACRDKQKERHKVRGMREVEVDKGSERDRERGLENKKMREEERDREIGRASCRER